MQNPRRPSDSMASQKLPKRRWNFTQKKPTQNPRHPNDSMATQKPPRRWRFLHTQVLDPPNLPNHDATVFENALFLTPRGTNFCECDMRFVRARATFFRAMKKKSALLVALFEKVSAPKVPLARRDFFSRFFAKKKSALLVALLKFPRAPKFH